MHSSLRMRLWRNSSKYMYHFRIKYVVSNFICGILKQKVIFGGKFGISSPMKRNGGLNRSGGEHVFENQMTQAHISPVPDSCKHTGGGCYLFICLCAGTVPLFYKAHAHWSRNPHCSLPSPATGRMNTPSALLSIFSTS